MASPIADLSYRNYDGPLEKPLNRWWAIAKMTIQLGMAKRFGFWFFSSLAGLPYLILVVVFYVMEQLMASTLPLGAKNPYFERMVWKNNFITALSVSQLALMLLAMLIGIGTIANDNRANALLVYLSKPITRMDYLIGKWLGIFIPITVVVAVPTLMFYGYCFMSYRDYGFVSEDPKLILRLIPMILVPGFVHASLAIGISSLFNQGRIAGATYAGLFFIGVSFTKAMEVVHVIGLRRGGGSPNGIVDFLYYCSVDGIQLALAKAILGTDGGWPIPQGGQGGAPPMNLTVAAPSLWVFTGILFVISAISLTVAWSRIRAVEVIG